MSIIYSVTVSVEKPLTEGWIEWMLTEHIPDVMATGCFIGYQFHTLLESVLDSESVTFNVLYECKDLSQYQDYHDNFKAEMQAKAKERFASGVQSFRSLMHRY